MTVLVGRYGDRLGRRRCYALLFVALGAAGVALATTDRVELLLPLVLTGVLSTEVVESGPFTSLEQAMLASELGQHRLAAGFSIYNATATMAGSVGALLAGGPRLLQSLALVPARAPPR
jgi:MFS family permease